MKKIVALLGVMLLAVAAGAQTNISLPAGTAFKVKLENTLSTFSSKEGDPFSGRLTQDSDAGRQNRNSHRRYGAGPRHQSQ